MENYRKQIEHFEALANSAFQQKVDELRHKFISEMDKLYAHYLSLVLESLKLMDTMLQWSLHAEVSQTEGLLRVLRRVVEGSVLEYRIEAIFEDIRSKITLSETLQRLSNIKTTDIHLVLSLYNHPAALHLPPPRPVRFQLHETSAVPAKKRPMHRKQAGLSDWLCRNCMTLCTHMERNCKTCGFQPKDIQADL
jgi:hypothetical protein